MPSSFPPSPFDPPDPSVPRPTRSLKPWLFAGAGVAVLFFVFIGVALVVKQNALLAWTLTTLEQRVEARLAPDLAPEARQRLTTAFGAARTAVEAGKFDLFALERAQSKLLAASTAAPGEPLPEDQVLALAEALENVPRKAAETIPVTEPSGE